jgi:DNA-binding winged helix-turn-helix (wHTH) protein/Tfp pilus assembly protein PilF/TolB-like protein
MSTGKVVTFHPFSFDMELGRLATRGHPVHIPEQNVRLLVFLIQKSGTIATREELREVLWPEGAPFDEQQAINKAVSQLRTALRDDPTSPRYIETIPRRGYRFCAEIKRADPENPAEATFSVRSYDTAVPLAAAGPLGAPTAESRAASRAWLLSSRTIALLSGALLLVLASAGFWRWERTRPHPASAAPTVPTLAVPPLEPEGKDATRLAESFRLDLVDSLAQLPGLKVLSAHAFTSAPRDPKDVAQMARTQTADLLLLGKFEVKDGLCLIDLELVRSADFGHLATFHYSGSPAEFRHILASAQQDIFMRLHLRATLSATTESTANPVAYEAYLEGRRSLIERTDESLNKAVASFKRAVEIDPKFARAYSGMASAYMILAAHDTFPDGYQMARGLALHALELDPSLAEPHAILGCIAMSKDWDAAKAERELRRAVELDPDEASYHLWAATLYNFEGRFDDSLKQVDLARQEDPYWPPVYETEVGIAANAGQEKRVITAAQLLLRLTPAWPLAHRQIAAAYWVAGLHEDAIVEWRTLSQMESDPDGVHQENVGLEALRIQGPVAYAKLRLRAMDRSPSQNDPYELAEWCSYAGDNERALGLLQSLISHHDPQAVAISIDPAFESLHTDPRLRAMLSAAGLNFKQTLGQDS